MHHLNYCRQLRKELEEQTAINLIDIKYRKLDTALFCNGLGNSVKFLLPKGGCTIDDITYRGIADDIPLHLPFPMVALEYEGINDETYRDWQKNIVIAEERADMNCFLVRFAVKDTSIGKSWTLSKSFLIPNKNPLDRENLGVKGRPKFLIAQVEGHGGAEDFPAFRGGFKVFFDFLNIMQCSNVHTEVSHPIKDKSNFKKAALGFDSYHILTVSTVERSGATREGVQGSRCSPREHLRRGHIRKLQSGKTVWVNSALVNPGTDGKVIKDYRIQS